jgi:catechol 2,3-dioxygenase-like lactoylglutathione lyase family enzyme
MSQPIESLLTHYEAGRMSRRELVAILAALAAAPLPSAAQPAPAALKAATLNHASLIVSDLDRSVAFYRRAFGLDVKSTQQGGVNLAVGDAFLGIYQGGQTAMPHINHICFGIRDFDPAATVAALEGQGLPAESRTRDGVTQVYTADPDNLRIQLQDVSFCGGVGPLGNECRA